MSVVVEQRVAVDAPPAAVFAYVHEPRSRGAWDAMVDLCRLEAERPARGVRLHMRGRRTAPSWVGEYAEYAPPRRSVVRLVEGVGMPFRHFHQTLDVTPRASRSELTMRVEYEVGGPLRLLEPLVLRPRLARGLRRSLENVRAHFA